MPPALSITHLTKTYANGVMALKDISLTIKQNDFFALLGANGAGKSTMIGIICSLIRKTKGQIRVFGNDLDNAPFKAKSLIGVVPQEINFGIFEKISQILINQAGYYGISRKIALRRSEHYLKAMSLWHMRHQSAFRLSGGMKRRLMIARALMTEPKLLILDEPTAGVDIELRHSIWQFLKNLNQNGTTIILTTHYLEEAEQLCRQLAIIDRGRIIEETPIQSLIKKADTQTILLDLIKPVPPHITLHPFLHHRLDDYTLEMTIPQPYSINDLFATLNQQHIEVSSIRNKTNRLEELFINLIAKQPN